MNVLEALDRYLLQLEADGRSPHTLGQYGRHVRMLADWLADRGRSCTVDMVTSEDLAAFLADDAVRMTASGKPRNPRSTNAIRASLRGFFRFLVRAEVLVRDPSRLIRLAICAPPPPRALRQAEEDRLLGVLKDAEGFEAERDRVLVELLLGTGIRLSSALALDVEDVDLEEGVLLLRRVKGGREERVLLGDGIRGILAEYLAGRASGPVFGARDGKRISTRQAQRRFRMWGKRAGISSRATPHSCRHAFAMRLYGRTGDVLLVRRALGHRSLSSTIVYAQASEERVRAAL